MKLHELSPAEGSKKEKKRIGRGQGSGHGKTSGRGHKGQKARAGGKVRRGFEGGQMPLHRRLPKKGFTNVFRKTFAIVNIKDLEQFEANTTVDTALLKGAGLVKQERDGVKVLGEGVLSKPLKVMAVRITTGARRKILEAGGEVVLEVS